MLESKMFSTEVVSCQSSWFPGDFCGVIGWLLDDWAF